MRYVSLNLAYTHVSENARENKRVNLTKSDATMQHNTSE